MVSPIGASDKAGAVHQAIFRAASATGVDFNYLFNQARVESNLNPDATARTSSATGLYQFIEQSWLGVVARHGDEHGLGWAASSITRGTDGRYRVADPAMRGAILDLRRDPAASAAMAGAFASDNRDHLERRLGRPVEPVDLYLAHFLGAGGATRFLKAHDADPDASAAAIFPAAAGTNRSVFFNRNGLPRSLAEVRGRFAAKFQGANPDAAFGQMAEVSSFPRTTAQRSDTIAARPARAVMGTQARLAYLMLASLGVSA